MCWWCIVCVCVCEIEIKCVCGTNNFWRVQAAVLVAAFASVGVCN